MKRSLGPEGIQKNCYNTHTKTTNSNPAAIDTSCSMSRLSVLHAVSSVAGLTSTKVQARSEATPRRVLMPGARREATTRRVVMPGGRCSVWTQRVSGWREAAADWVLILTECGESRVGSISHHPG